MKKLNLFTLPTGLLAVLLITMGMGLSSCKRKTVATTTRISYCDSLWREYSKPVTVMEDGIQYVRKIDIQYLSIQIVEYRISKEVFDNTGMAFPEEVNFEMSVNPKYTQGERNIKILPVRLCSSELGKPMDTFKKGGVLYVIGQWYSPGLDKNVDLLLRQNTSDGKFYAASYYPQGYEAYFENKTDMDAQLVALTGSVTNMSIRVIDRVLRPVSGGMNLKNPGFEDDEE